MLSCMAEDIVHLFKDIKSVKGIWDALQWIYEIMSTRRLNALELKVKKLKCVNNKGMEKHLLTFSPMITNLKKAGHHYSDEQKWFTLLNLLTIKTRNNWISRECMDSTLILVVYSCCGI